MKPLVDIFRDLRLYLRSSFTDLEGQLESFNVSLTFACCKASSSGLLEACSTPFADVEQVEGRISGLFAVSFKNV